MVHKLQIVPDMPGLAVIKKKFFFVKNNLIFIVQAYMYFNLKSRYFEGYKNCKNVVGFLCTIFCILQDARAGFVYFCMGTHLPTLHVPKKVYTQQGNDLVAFPVLLETKYTFLGVYKLFSSYSQKQYMSNYSEHNIIIFGDSITFGEWGSQGGWATRLKQHYLQTRVANTYAVHTHVLGVKSQTSDELITRIPSETGVRMMTGIQPIFIVYIGTNDARVDKNTQRRYAMPDVYIQNIQAIIQKLRQYDYS